MDHHRARPQRRDRNVTALDVIFIGMLAVLLLAMAIGLLSPT
jgi:cell division protein FtsL